MLRVLRGLGLALGFLSRVPAPAISEPGERDFAWALFWFPGIGLVLGACLFCIAWVGQTLMIPVAVQAALLVAALSALTGGLHLDGLADTVDGLSGGGDRAERLSIMRDSRIGAHGAVAVVVVLLLKYALLQALLVDGALAAGRALMVSVVTARVLAVLAVAAFPYAREGGLGLAFKAAAYPILVLVAGVWPAALVFAPWFDMGLAVAAGVVLLLGWIVARWLSGKLGGLTGDAYGALIECAEVIAWLTLVLTQSAS